MPSIVLGSLSSILGSTSSMRSVASPTRSLNARTVECAVSLARNVIVMLARYPSSRRAKRGQDFGRVSVSDGSGIHVSVLRFRAASEKGSHVERHLTYRRVGNDDRATPYQCRRAEPDCAHP